MRLVAWLPLLLCQAVPAQVDVLMSQYDLSRTSSNLQETVLTRSNVNAQQFGKLFSRTVDAPFYASPLVVTNLAIPGVGTRNVVYVATLGNTVYALDADDSSVTAPYWSVNLGPPIGRNCCYLGPTLGILGTPAIDRVTNTIYVAGIVDLGAEAGLFLHAFDLSTGEQKFGSPRRITYSFASGVTKSNARLSGGSAWLQRAGLLVTNNTVYVGTSNVWEGSTITTQQGFIQAYKADELNVLLGSFETTPTGQGGGFWQAGRGISADASGNIFAAINSGGYSPPLTYGSSVVKLTPSLSVASWFTPFNWSFLDSNNLDVSAGGVTLIPGTSLAFNGGKIGVIYLLDQTLLGGLEPGLGGVPLQQFQASQGCGTDQCGQHLPTAFWPSSTPTLYVWDIYDKLRAVPFDPVSQRFQPAAASSSAFVPSRTGGMAVTSNGSASGTGIVWAATAAQDPFSKAVPGTLRAFNANDVTQELYNSDQNSCRDSMGSFVKMSTPTVANGKVYTNTHSNSLPVYGLLSTLSPPAPPAGTVHVTVRASIDGPTIGVDSGIPCTGAAEFDWLPGSPHTLTVDSPHAGLPGTSPQAGDPGRRFVWTGWSDGGLASHSVSPSTPTIFIANFSTQYFLSTGVSPEAGGSIQSVPASASGYYDSGTSVQLTATPIPNCVFLNWSGSISGGDNPRTVVMSAAQKVTATFQCSVPPPASFVTGFSHRIIRADFSGWVGMRFTVGNTALNVRALGRINVYGNTAPHIVKLIRSSDGMDVGSVVVSPLGSATNRIKYVSLASPVILQPNTTYYLVSQETISGDQWFDLASISTTNAAAVTNSIYSPDGSGWSNQGTPNTSYGPVSFLYTTGDLAQYTLTTSVWPANAGTVTASPEGATYLSGTSVQLTATPAAGCSFTNWTGAVTGTTNPQNVMMLAARSVTANFQCVGPQPSSFLTGFALNNPQLRRDFSGWVGLKFTVGANELPVSSLGRICVTGNATAHNLKVVKASDGSDVPGSNISVNLAGCTPAQFAYGAVNITLAASTSYYLVSQEVYGGDEWYDQGGVSATAAAAINSSVYSNGANWTTIGSPNTSYVPVNFLYSIPTPPPVDVTIQSSPSGASFLVDGTAYSSPQTITWTSGSSHSLATTSPQSAGTGAQRVWTGWSDGGAMTHSVSPAQPTTYTANFATQYLLTATITPSAGGSISRSPSSPGGYYESGTPVELTAVPAPGCTLTGWSGALSGAGVVQSLVMTGPLAATANFECVAPTTASFLSGFASTTLRRDFTGWVGFKFTVGANPQTIAALGRICVAGNSGTHVLKLVSTSGVEAASISLNMTNCTAGQFIYGATSSVVLPAGGSYYLVSQETSGGDQWYDVGSVFAANVAAINSAVYSSNGNTWNTIGAANTSYVPVNFQYALTSTPQFALTTNVSPAGAGSVTLNPPGGTYSAGTIVQVTATPAANCTFSSWTGGLTGADNPQSITMSAAQSVTANFQCTAPSGTSFVTGFTTAGRPLRNDYSGWVGMRLSVGANPLTVVSLGRVCVAGNSLAHIVKLVNAGGSDIASGLVSMTGCTPGQFAYVSISPITLQTATSYYLVSQEVQSGDRWYDQGPVSTSSVASVLNAAYSSGGAFASAGSANTYGPVSLLYSAGAPVQYTLTTNVSPSNGGTVSSNPPGGSYAAGSNVQLTAAPASGCSFLNWSGAVTGSTNPTSITMSNSQAVTANFQCGPPPPGTSFVTSFSTAGRPLRNDYSGWVGMRFTVGSTQLSIVSLGRICVANNSAAHTVKLVHATSGSEVANVSVNMSGCTAGQFVYGTVSVTLPAGGTYYLVSQEVQSGDRWYDQGPVSATSTATINSSVYSSGSTWIPIGSPNTSYVPVSFEYTQ